MTDSPEMYIYIHVCVYVCIYLVPFGMALGSTYLPHQRTVRSLSILL